MEPRASPPAGFPFPPGRPSSSPRASLRTSWSFAAIRDLHRRACHEFVPPVRFSLRPWRPFFANFAVTSFSCLPGPDTNKRFFSNSRLRVGCPTLSACFPNTTLEFFQYRFSWSDARLRPSSQSVINLLADLCEHRRSHAPLEFFKELPFFLADMAGKRLGEPSHSRSIERSCS
jgi:hypothetical protein